MMIEPRYRIPVPPKVRPLKFIKSIDANCKGIIIRYAMAMRKEDREKEEKRISEKLGIACVIVDARCEGLIEVSDGQRICKDIL